MSQSPQKRRRKIAGASSPQRSRSSNSSSSHGLDFKVIGIIVVVVAVAGFGLGQLQKFTSSGTGANNEPSTSPATNSQVATTAIPSLNSVTATPSSESTIRDASTSGSSKNEQSTTATTQVDDTSTAMASKEEQTSQLAEETKETVEPNFDWNCDGAGPVCEVVVANWNLQPKILQELPQPMASSEVAFDVKGTERDLRLSKLRSPFVLDVFKKGYHFEKLRLINMRTGESISEVEAESQGYDRATLSPDGKLLAIRVLGEVKRTRIAVWSVQTGTKLTEFVSGPQELTVKALSFVGPDNLLVSLVGKLKRTKKEIHQTRIFNARTGSPVVVKDDGNIGFYDGLYALTSDGGYLFARWNADQILVFDTKTLDQVGSLSFTRPNDLVRSISSISISNRGDRLLVLGTRKFDCWLKTIDIATGKELQSFQYPKYYLFTPQLFGIVASTVDWLADDSGWIVGGTSIIDAESGRLIWKLDPNYQSSTGGISFANRSPRIPTDKGLFTFRRVIPSTKTTHLPVEHTQLRSLLSPDAVSDSTLLFPGAEIDLELDFRNVQFDQEELVENKIVGPIRQQLAASNMKVVEGARIKLRVDYEEKAGEERTFFTAKSRTEIFRGRGLTVAKSTIFDFQCQLIDTSSNKILWEFHVEKEPKSYGLRGEVSTEKLRNHQFESFLFDTVSLNIPYFVSDGGNTFLPMFVDLNGDLKTSHEDTEGEKKP